MRLADGTVGFVYAPNLTGPGRPLSGEERALAYQPAPLRTGRSATIPFLFNPLAVEEWQLWTPLTLAQCQERLQAELIAGGSGSWFGFDDTSGAYSVRGKVSAQGFSIQKPHASRSWYVPTRAAGRFLPGADGTHLTVRLGINAFQIAPG